MNDIQYQILAARRQAYDQLLWQTPVLSLTAQAFLLTIALGAGNSSAARFLSASLSLVTALASILLMAKHRYYEVIASKALQKYESEKMSDGFDPIHKRRPSSDDLVSFWERWPLFVIWILTLFSFAVVALIVVLKPSLF